MKTALKVTTTVGYIGVNWLTGYAIGAVLSKIVSKILTEKLAEEHAVIFWLLFVLYMAILVGTCVAVGIIDPWRKLYDWIMNKIDGQTEEQDEFDE